MTDPKVPRPLRVDDLRAAWGGAGVEESTVRWYAAEPKKARRAAFPDHDWEVLATTAYG